MKLIFYYLIFSINAHAILIAHRGVHQTYTREGLDNDTCTAIRINNTGHSFLENTIESIEEAFKGHADMVEVDVHPTKETNAPEGLVVFHDWTLNCRTEARCEDGCKCNDKNQCETNKQSLNYLQTLDVGFGYTPDNGESYPFRGLYKRKMPDFSDVLNLLEKYRDKKILVNVKGNTERTARAFLRIIKNYPLQIRQRLYYPYKYGFQEELKEMGVARDIDQKDKQCFIKYLQTGWYGHFPKECHNKRIFVPIRETLERVIGKPGRLIKFTSILWGWPEKFIELAHKNGTEIYASQVDSIEEYKEMRKLDLDGVMTNRIEVIGPFSIRERE